MLASEPRPWQEPWPQLSQDPKEIIHAQIKPVGRSILNSTSRTFQNLEIPYPDVSKLPSPSARPVSPPSRFRAIDFRSLYAWLRLDEPPPHSLTTMRALSLSLPLALAPLVAAISPPTCPESAHGYQIEKVVFLYKVFCNSLASSNFASQERFTGSAADPWISLGFESANAAAACSEAGCGSDFGGLIDACALRNHTIFGAGHVATACGTYNMTIWDPAFEPGKNGTQVPSAAPAGNTGAAVESIASVVASSFSLPGVAKTSETSTSVSTTSSSASSSSPRVVSSTISSSPSSSASAMSSPVPIPTAIPFPTDVATNSTITNQGPFGNGTSVVFSTASGTAVTTVLWTTGTPSVAAGGSGVTGTAAGAASTTNVSGGVRRDVNECMWRLMWVGIGAIFLL
ncbi:hypothetical protein BJ875DRAFT_31168 [Amylocarpus encephaloides]|uniref:Uncharacterized protein n=1 Tax=Amylocarpus encephaloides TaxID=45428 RepID=A0A9P8C4Q7_9HELO|nr:hypothetical protein BJ875DRAFT_31168 [Amylocarpus encephaloides]